jgi:hypothetical protein
MRARNHGYAVSLCGWVGAVALACVSLNASPAGRYGSEFQAFMDLSAGVGKHTVGFKNGGVPVTTRGVPGPTLAGNMNFTHAAGGRPKLTGEADIPNAAGTLPMKVTQPVTAASAGYALANFAANFFLPLAVGVAIFDTLAEMNGWTLVPNGDGTNTIKKQADGYCLSGQGTCYEYSGSTATGFHRTPELACQAFFTANPTLSGFAHTYKDVVYTTPSSTQNHLGAVCRGTWAFNNSTSTQGIVERTRAPDASAPTVTKTIQELADAIAAQSGWPSGSAIDRALADAVNAGYSVEPDGLATMEPTVTTSVTAPPVVKANPDGSKETTTAKCEWIVPFGASIAEERCWIETTTTTPEKTTTETVTTTHPDGTTSTSTISKTTPSTTTTSTGTSTTTPEKDLCKLHPDILACKLLDLPSVEVPKATKTVSYSQDDLGLGTGSCPPPVEFSTSKGNYSVSYQAACDVATNFLRPALLAIAAIMAYFIMAGGLRSN